MSSQLFGGLGLAGVDENRPTDNSALYCIVSDTREIRTSVHTTGGTQKAHTKRKTCKK